MMPSQSAPDLYCRPEEEGKPRELSLWSFSSLRAHKRESGERGAAARGMRALPGKGLARKHTLLVEADELDEEVHVAPEDRVELKQSHIDTPPRQLSAIQLCRSESMSQYEALSDALAISQIADHVSEASEGKDNGSMQQINPDSGDSLLARPNSTELTAEKTCSHKISLTSVSDQQSLTRTVSSEGPITIKLSGGDSGSEGILSLDADSIAFYRQHSTAHMGTSVIFPLRNVQSSATKFRRFDLTCSDFKTWKHFTSGSHSDIFKVKCALSVLEETGSDKGQLLKHALQPGLKVIIKAIKDSELQNNLVLREFDSERELLASLSHLHILKFLGAGVDLFNNIEQLGSSGNGERKGMCRTNSMHMMLKGRAKVLPRPFLVLERLDGGSLALLLAQHQQINSVIPICRALQICHQLALAVDYLHNQFHSEAVVIHRDIKPDNIAFDQQGLLKLMDFGISTCIRRDVLAEGPYLMTGMTGSLRYMAKEVYLQESYNQAVDVYSLGILMWHITTCSMPFPKFSRQQFEEQVVNQDLRPPIQDIRKIWSESNEQVESLIELIQNCWAPNWRDRPVIEDVLQKISILLENEVIFNATIRGGCCGV